MILHIVSKNRWHGSGPKGRGYRGDTLETEGFIHFSTKAQVVATANRFYSGQTDLLLVCVDEGALTAELKYEDPGEGQLFPHLYGPLNAEAVVDVFAFPPQPDGTFTLPPELG